MIKARHQLFVYSFFKIYTLAKMRTNFNSVKLNGTVDVADHSVLLIANHIGWWDGFWALYLSMRIFQKKYHFMIIILDINLTLSLLFLNFNNDYQYIRISNE